MEELDGLWKKISLSELEDDKFNLSSSEGDQKPTLVAKFFTRRTINVEVTTRTCKPLWRTERGFSARDLGDNLVMFEFDDNDDLERVFLYEPWSFDKHLVAFRRLEGEADPQTLVFNQTTFWVQIHSRPILFLKKDTVVSLEREVGKVLRTSETNEEVGGGRIMRIRVVVDITKPLCCGRKIGLNKGGEGWVSFKYKRLPNFCYWCGLLTHGEKYCNYWLKNQEVLSREEQGSGVRLRAGMDRPLRKVEIQVAGRSKTLKQMPKPSGSTQIPPEQGNSTVIPTPHWDSRGDMECEDTLDASIPVTGCTGFKHATLEE